MAPASRVLQVPLIVQVIWALLDKAGVRINVSPAKPPALLAVAVMTPLGETATRAR